ncbi:MAG TPA: hypothetical protein VK828_02995 [Terriglobales bacterium]|jgi:hypothetical protein|nr:hypothetical protein [Terriglobales bacterium]
MSSTSVAVTGFGPFEFTDSQGKQVSIPLTALTLSNNQIQSSNAQWNTYLGSAPALNLWKYMLAEGLLSPMPSPSPFPAMVIRAASEGAAGNNIAVNITVPTPPSSPAIEDPTNLPFTIQVTETDTYTNQTAATIANTLETANALVQVVGPVQTGGIPESFSGTFMGSPDQISIVDTASPGGTLFVLVPRTPGPNPLHINVTIDFPSPPNSNPEAFTLTASWTSPTLSATLDTLASVISELAPEIIISKPGSGAYSLPQAGTTTLSGGTATSNASANIYTSLP